MNTLKSANLRQAELIDADVATMKKHSRNCLQPFAIAVASMLVALVSLPTAAQTSASSNSRIGAVPAGGLTASPASYLSLPSRIRSAVGELKIEISNNQFPADGVSSIEVQVEVLGTDGKRVTLPVDVSVQVSAGARIIAAGKSLVDANADEMDVDKIAPGLQLRNKDGLLKFKVVAPVQPGDVLLQVRSEGREVELPVSAMPDQREMFMVGLVELQVHGDKFDSSKILPPRENDGLDQELRAWRTEFGNGKGYAAGRAALYLKGTVRGDYLLTLSYDSERNIIRRLFQDIDPNGLYAVYGDSSQRGYDVQSASKLYVRVDKGRSNLIYGDLNTALGAHGLGSYARSVTGLRAHYEEGNIAATAWVARTSMRQVIDEFPARGVSGPYSLSNPNGVQGTEKVEIVIRDRNQPAVILKVTPLQRFSDYEFEPFSGQILFRSPIPSIDDQLNIVSVRVTYEIEQGGQNFTVAGSDISLKITPKLSVGASIAKDQNPAAPYQVAGAVVEGKIGEKTLVRAEFAHTDGTPNTGASVTNPTADKNGNATKIEIRHDGEDARLRAFALKAEDGFDNPASGITGGRTEIGIQGSLKITKEWNVRGEVIRSEDSITHRKADGAQLGLAYKPTEKSEFEIGFRRAEQNAASLLQTGAISCNGSSVIQPGLAGTSGVGYGISPIGGQQIDPTTGLPVVCNGARLNQDVASRSDTTSNNVYLRGRYALFERVSVFGEVGRDSTKASGPSTSDSSQTTYALGGEYRPYDNTRLYLRHDYSRSYTGLFGLGTGDGVHITTFGVDTEYRPESFAFSEYRLRDGASARDVQHAIGLRNGFNIAQGLKLTTGAEVLRTVSSTAPAPGSTPGNLSKALSLGLEYTASPIWKASGRVEWRDDNQATNWLATTGIAGKIDRDWTVLARNYFSQTTPDLGGKHTQDRLQVGMAYRPVDTNTFDALGQVEFKTDKDDTAILVSNRTADIVSARFNWHPCRTCFFSGRVALKRVKEDLLGTPASYYAQLVSGRAMYDITNRWSLGANWSVLRGQGGAKQYAYGPEIGFVAIDNLWLVAGYTWRGFSDTDLALENYTNRGWYLGMRYKFSEDLLGAKDAAVNKTVVPQAKTGEKK